VHVTIVACPRLRAEGLLAAFLACGDLCMRAWRAKSLLGRELLC
jgi:hypothetical protein